MTDVIIKHQKAHLFKIGLYLCCDLPLMHSNGPLGERTLQTAYKCLCRARSPNGPEYFRDIPGYENCIEDAPKRVKKLLKDRK
jgi:hypothetical protein